MRRAGGSGDESSKVCVDMISFSNIVCIVISEFQSVKKEKNLFGNKRGFDIDNHTIFKLEYNEN